MNAAAIVYTSQTGFTGTPPCWRSAPACPAAR